MTLFFRIIVVLVFSVQLHSQTDVFDASRAGDVQRLKTLYAKTPSLISSKNNSGYSPLMIAAYRGRLNVVRFLIDKVEDIDESSKYGTPLMAAAIKGHTEIAILLIENNANVNYKDINGTTALHYATMFKFYDIVSCLLSCNAKSNIKDNRGNTALDYAKLLKDTKLINLLTN